MFIGLLALGLYIACIWISDDQECTKYDGMFR